MVFQAVVILAGIPGEKNNPWLKVSKSKGNGKVINAKKVTGI
jgi:hypothetical protein